MQLACSALSFAQVIQDLAGLAETGRDRSCTARVFPSCSRLRRRADPASCDKLIDLRKGEVSAGRIVETEHSPRGQPPNHQPAACCMP